LANAHRIPMEQEKEARLEGFYIHLELYGAPAEKQIEWARHPKMMKRIQQQPASDERETGAAGPIVPRDRLSRATVKEGFGADTLPHR
jgi:hypothetical protein